MILFPLLGVAAASAYLARAGSLLPFLIWAYQLSRHPYLVKGKVFDRFVSIWLENTDYATALSDPNISALQEQGIQLNNYFAVTHPSEPNYIASAGGDYFGMNNDDVSRVPANVSTVVDLLVDKGISWAEYEEDMPFSGDPEAEFFNPATGAGDYVRKHNPLIIFDSVANVPDRANLIKNFTLFYEDLNNNALPQWMFITPNLTNDGHDTNITVAGSFVRRFLEALLANKHFNGEGTRTLIQLTFDESGTYNVQNRVRTILLGSAVPEDLRGTQDNTFYTHYSVISTIEANWDMHTLGRYDVGANVFAFVAKHTGDKLRVPQNPPLSKTFLNESYPGVFNSKIKGPLPVPNTRLVINGRSVLPQIVRTWGSEALQRCTIYSGVVEIPSGTHPPVLPAGCPA